MKTDKSQEAYEKALELIPGGVDSPVRAFGSVKMSPIFIDHAKGSKIIDIDGNAYIDLIGSWGPMILGHASEALDGIEEVIKKGTSFGLPTEKETELAEMIVDAFPSIEQIRFVNSGTEAVMSALRLARAYTKKNKIIKFEGGYHGHTDSMLIQAGSGAANIPSSLGVSESFVEDTLVAPYNSLKEVRELFEDYEDIAAVIVEPVAGNMGVIPPEPGFLEGLREITSENGALLIFDEVITGFRTAYGGVQTLTGIEPDLTTLGKIIGGGLPVGAFGGREEIMRMLAPKGKVYQAGTLSGNPVAVSLGISTLKSLKENPEIYERLKNKAEYLKKELEKSAKKYGLPVSVNSYRGMLSLFFRDHSPKNFEEAEQSDTDLYRRFFKGMLERGVLFPPSQFEGLFLSAAHSKKDISNIISAADEVFGEIS